MNTLNLSTYDNALVTDLVTRQIINIAKDFEPIDAKKQPHTHAVIWQDFKSLCSILARLTDEPVENKLIEKFYDAAMIDAAHAEGIDWNKEMQQWDPRASRPRCVHGKYFTEPCEPCGDGWDGKSEPPRV